MGTPVVFVESGGIPVTESTNGLGLPVVISENGLGLAVTRVSSGGMPIYGGLTWLPRLDGEPPTLYTNFSESLFWFDGKSYSSLSEWLTACGGAFTRADTGEYYDAAGLKKTAAINAPRFDHHPVTLKPRGMRFRGARTNLVINSASISNATWTKTGLTIASATGLDGTLSASSLIVTTATSAHAAVRAVTVVSGSIYTWWAKVKPAGRTWARLSDGAGNSTYFDLAGITTGTVPSGFVAFILPLSNGYFHIGVTKTTASTSASMSVGPADGNNHSSYLGDGVSGIIVDSCGIELGSYPSDLNPTGGSALTTSADSLVIGPSSGLPFPGFNSSGFTIVVSGTVSIGAEPSTNQVFLALDDGTDTNKVIIGRGSVSGGGRKAVFNSAGGTGAIALVSTQDIGDTRQFRIAISCESGVQHISLNGAPCVSGTGNTVLPSIDRMVIGNKSGLGASTFGCIDEIAVFPAAATAEDTQRLAGPDYPAFGWGTDLHYDSVTATYANRYVQDGVKKMDDAVATWNAYTNLDFAQFGGDFVDEGNTRAKAFSDIATITASFAAANAPHYLMLGNHDMANMSKAEFMAATGMTANRYSFDYRGVHFIVLDAEFGADDDAAIYNSGNYSADETYVPPSERDWLEADLAATNLPTVVFCHPTFFTLNGHLLVNSDSVRSILEASGKVFATFSGHSHGNALVVKNGIKYYAMQAMTENAWPDNAYAVIIANPNDRSIIVEGFGGQTSYP